MPQSQPQQAPDAVPAHINIDILRARLAETRPYAAKYAVRWAKAFEVFADRLNQQFKSFQTFNYTLENLSKDGEILDPDSDAVIHIVATAGLIQETLNFRSIPWEIRKGKPLFYEKAGDSEVEVFYTQLRIEQIDPVMCSYLAIRAAALTCGSRLDLQGVDRLVATPTLQAHLMLEQNLRKIGMEIESSMAVSSFLEAAEKFQGTFEAVTLEVRNAVLAHLAKQSRAASADLN
jgi:hypothetical protein